MKLLRILDPELYELTERKHPGDDIMAVSLKIDMLWNDVKGLPYRIGEDKVGIDMKGNGTTYTIDIPENTQIIYLRFNNDQGAYQYMSISKNAEEMDIYDAIINWQANNMGLHDFPERGQQLNP